jgi:integrase
VLKTYIKPVAMAAGLPSIGWHSFRHSVSAWGKEAGLELEEVKTLMRHENIATTSDVYGDLGLDAKRRIQRQLVEFVRQQAEDEVAEREGAWPPDTPATIQ